MVHWSWLIISAMFGGVVGLIVMAAVAAGADADKRTEADRGKKG